MSEQAPGHGPDAGTRLSKRVMAAAGCSRAEAERLIAQGDVTVDGAVQREPAHRVADAQAVQVRAGARPQPSAALTLLWHKPQGDVAPPAQARGLRCAAALPTEASGLVVFTGQPGVWRVLTERDPPLEREWLIDLPGVVGALSAPAPQVLGPGVRASVSSQTPERTRLRAVVRGLWQPPADLVPLRLHRLRLGRVALGTLAEGDTRALRLDERF